MSNLTGTSKRYASRRNHFVLGDFTISSGIPPSRGIPRVSFAAIGTWPNPNRGETPRGEREPRKLPRTTLGTGQYIVHRNVRESSWPERERPPSLTHHRRPLLRWWGSATPTGLPYTLQSYMRPPDANLPPSGRQFTLSTSGRPPSALQLHESGLPARVPALQTP